LLEIKIKEFRRINEVEEVSKLVKTLYKIEKEEIKAK